YSSRASAEKIGSRSCSSAGHSASSQSGLSRAAPSPIASQRSTVAELANGLDGAVDVLVRVGEGEEQRFELGRSHVDPALEQVAKERAVTLGICLPCLVVVAHGLLAQEE